MIRPALLGLLATTLMATGCSHTTPYVRHDVATVSPSELPGVEGPGVATIVGDPFIQRILLIGDAGENDTPPPIFGVLGEWASVAPHRTVIVFLGDNVYPSGIPPEPGAERDRGLRRLDLQLEVARRTGATAVVLPGNHDWDEGGVAGRARVDTQAARVREILGDGGHFLPAPGEPGPAVLDREGIRLVAIDTDWWLLAEEGERDPAVLAATPERVVLDAIGDAIDGAGGRIPVLLAHHPLASHGPHGGFHDWTDHIFPLHRLAPWAWIPTPVVGSLYPLIRANLAVSRQDLRHPRNRHMVASLESVFESSPPVVVASGHDHGIQILDGAAGASTYVVSGAGSKPKLVAIGDGPDTRFALQRPGFVALDLLDEERLLVRVVTGDDPEVVYAEVLPVAATPARTD